MLPDQSDAVDKNMVELVKAAEWVIPVVLSYFQTSGVLSNGEVEVIKSEITSPGKLNILFGILKTKDSGWSSLLSYLRTNGQSGLADKLQDEANEETSANGSKRHKRSALVEFSFRLARYYRHYYATVPTMGQSDKHVKDVWVPLAIDCRKEEFLAAKPIDHTQLLNQLKSTDEADVALIKGDPGMGKTTLVKKIAYDWAVNYGTSNNQQLRLVLAVPLRSVGKSNRFDQLAIDYFLSVIDVEDLDKAELTREIKQLKSQLLVILDGLDEYNNYSECPFKVMFSGPFQHSSAYSKDPPPIITFKLIITSRPYACQDVQMAFPLLRFVILPLDVDHLSNFVQFYCETSQGAARVTEYLKTNSKVVIKVPLILTFICYLADSYKEIPTNMTSLYDSFIRQMLRRENRQEKLAESIDIQSWKNSNMIKTSSKLAYGGSTDILGKYEFSKLDLDKYHVTNDSFICGFLLHKFNFTQDILMAEFPHRSIQEFFAALHCYQLMLTGRKDELSEVNNMIIMRGDSLVGRFFFGICSKEERFDQMTKWLRPSLLDYNRFRPAVVINSFNSALADCLSEQNLSIGQKLFDSAGNLDNYKFEFELAYLYKEEFLLRSDQFSDDFKKGLHLRVLYVDERGLTTDWFLADNRKSTRLACVQHRLQQLLEEKFDQIDFLFFTYGSIDRSTSLHSVQLSRTQPQSDSQVNSETLVHQIQQLPPVVTLVITPEVDLPFTITTVCIRCGSELGLRLANFQFHYKTTDRDELLGTVAKEKLADLTVDEKTEDKRAKTLTIRKFKVTVNEAMAQSTLIFSLMRMSLLSKEERTTSDEQKSDKP